MKITGVETFHVKPRWIFVKVTTDEGIIGWGECDLEGYNLVTAAAVDSLKDIIIGQDPRNICTKLCMQVAFIVQEEQFTALSVVLNRLSGILKENG